MQQYSRSFHVSSTETRLAHLLKRAMTTTNSIAPKQPYTNLLTFSVTKKCVENMVNIDVLRSISTFYWEHSQEVLRLYFSLHCTHKMDLQHRCTKPFNCSTVVRPSYATPRHALSFGNHTFCTRDISLCPNLTTA